MSSTSLSPARSAINDALVLVTDERDDRKFAVENATRADLPAARIALSVATSCRSAVLRAKEHAANIS